MFKALKILPNTQQVSCMVIINDIINISIIMNNATRMIWHTSISHRKQRKIKKAKTTDIYDRELKIFLRNSAIPMK